ncbi:replicative DNA helicase [Lentibacillus sp. Marseille-P4043]|uniref:replicative DNA helicase n=1 Tax=Lentibacillus sp. Marseille-P4043 TaxID=2040293 RepID=UPI000D0B66C5|nr:replicative DNA helicase [Lentibacillus sp. Marseille-P4043]
MTNTNMEAEAAILGAVLYDGTVFKELTVQEEHFHFAKHKKIYRAMKKASEQDDLVDMVMVTTYLGKDIDEVGGTTYLLQMAESVPSMEGLQHYERLVFDSYRARESSKHAFAYAENPTDQRLDVLINSLQTYRDAGVVKMEKTTSDYLIEITEAMCDPQSEQSGFITAFDEFDEMTGGLQRGELIIVAARPSVGKTAFALNLAANHCKNGGSSIMFSLEMVTKQLLQRLISAGGTLDGQKWRSMAFSEQDYERAIRAVGDISNWELTIFDQKRTITEIRSAIRKTALDRPEEKHVAFIDYLQLIAPGGKKERRDLEIGEITRELKLLAMELNIPIVLLSQLSRGVESRQNKRPLMSDLRESGNIEQDADLIAFLYRDDYYDTNSDRKNKIEVILSKQRNGPTGTVELFFNKEYGRFENTYNKVMN